VFDTSIGSVRVTERGAEAVEHVHHFTGGHGAYSVPPTKRAKNGG
jgi:hypothetical protein